MNKRSIEIIIAPSGEIQIDAVGFKGPDREKATRFLEEALGVVGQDQEARVSPAQHHQEPAEVGRTRALPRGAIGSRRPHRKCLVAVSTLDNLQR